MPKFFKTYRDDYVRIARQVALNRGFTTEEASEISLACKLTDTDVSASPYNLPNQIWCFDKTDSWDGWATGNDSRMVHVCDKLGRAIEFKKQKRVGDALKELGYGLCALQDMFVYTPDVVKSISGARLDIKYLQVLGESYLDGFIKESIVLFEQSLSIARDNYLKKTSSTPPTQGWQELYKLDASPMVSKEDCDDSVITVDASVTISDESEANDCCSTKFCSIM